MSDRRSSVPTPMSDRPQSHSVHPALPGGEVPTAASRLSERATDGSELRARLSDAQIDALWKAYQLGQISADHTAKEVFAEVLRFNLPAAMSDSTVAAPEVTDAMVDAYLKANDAYWKRTDELPASAKNPGRWREGTPREATRESLRAALGIDSTVAAAGAGGDDDLTVAYMVGYSKGKAWAASLSATGVPTQPSGAKVVQTVTSCRECPNRRYDSSGLYGCDKVGLRHLSANCVIPSWCPLGDYPATPSPAPAVAAITERRDSVHPAAPNSNVASLAPFSEPSACESSELPVRPKSDDQCRTGG